MFSNNFVTAIKVNGKVLREFDGTVALPFGSEYSILLKNLSADKKAKVKVSIDGKDVTEDVFLVIGPGESTELKRFIRNGNLSAGNAFKFIEKTAQIEAFRGNKAEDGLITVIYEFEQKIDWSAYRSRGIVGGCTGYDGTRITYTNNLGHSGDGLYFASNTAGPMAAAGEPEMQLYSSSEIKMSAGSVQASASLNYSDSDSGILRSRRVSPSNFTKSAATQPLNADGITAPGSVVEQQFSSTYNFSTDGVKHTMTLQLKGKVKDDELVKEAVIVKKLTRCQMCGTNTRQTAKFCHNCGAAVEIV